MFATLDQTQGLVAISHAIHAPVDPGRRAGPSFVVSTALTDDDITAIDVVACLHLSAT